MRLNQINDNNDIENESDNEAAALADEMIGFLSEQFHEADRDEKRELVLQYGSVLKQLHKVRKSAKRNRMGLHRYPFRL